MNLKEVDKPEVTKTVVVYSGRFQPFHSGHYISYLKLCKKFGKDNVYIGTSNDTSGAKSPFNFNEKVKIMTKMFGVPSDKIVQVRNPYAPKEILSHFDGKTTQYIAAVGEKDADRLKGKYFKPYNGKAGYGYEEIGYVYPVPAESNAISGTDVRNWLGKGADEEKKKGFLKAYPKFDKDIFNMITGKLNESVNTEPSSALRPEPHPTRHEIEHPEDEKKAFDGNKAPYDPIGEIIDEYITNELFEAFIENYLGEAPNANLDQDISYTDTKGKPKKIKARSALRLPKDHPAHIAASKLVGNDKVAKKAKGPADAPANEPKKAVEPGKAATQAAKPSVPGQPVKKDQTPQGKANKAQSGEPTDKAKGAAGETPQQADPQKLKGAELKSDAEKKQDKEKGFFGKWGDKFKAEVEEIGHTIKNFLNEDEAHAAHEAHDPHSPTRKKWTEQITDFVAKMPANIAKHALKVAKQKVHQVKNTARGVQSLAVSLSKGDGLKLGYFKDRDGQWKRSEREAERQKKAMKATAYDIAVTAAAVVAGHAVAAGKTAYLAGKGISGALKGAGHGVSHMLHSSAGEFLHHMAVDFGKHCYKESIFLATGAGHEEAANLAMVAGVIPESVYKQFINEEEETKQNAMAYSEMLKQTLEKMQTFEPNPKQYLAMLKSYAAKKQKGSLDKMMGSINENLSDRKEANIQHFVEYATKRLKLKEEPRIQFIEGEEYANAKSSLGGYDPITKEIYVAVEGRLTADILRTLAHEMVHRKQDELGLIGDAVKAGADGSPVENQAHAVAGILMREYGRLNKEIYTEATLKEVSGLSGDDSQSDGAYLPRGRGRVLDGDDGVNKSDNWYKNGGYIQTDFPVADAIFGDDDENQVVVNYSASNLPRTNKSIETEFPKREDKVEILPEDINIDVDKGDTVLMGKFKNKKTTVKDIGTDDHGMPTINGKKATTFRIPRGSDQNVFDEVTTNDWHFKAIMKLYDKAGSFGKKKIGVVVCNDPKASRRDIVVQLRDTDYEEVTAMTDKLGLNEYIEKKKEKYEQLVSEYFTTLNEYFDVLNEDIATIDATMDDQNFRSPYLPDWESFDSNGANYAEIVGYTMIGHDSTSHIAKTGNVAIPTKNPSEENGPAQRAIHASKGEEYAKEKAEKWEMYPFNTRPSEFGAPDVEPSKKGKPTQLSEKISQSNLDSVERYADRELDPADIEFSNHFFDRVNDTRNGKEISEPELTGFFKRLSRHKKQFLDFLDKYNQIVVKDDRSNINIPFVKMANKVIAKTVMRKGDFQTSSPTIVNEITQGLYAGTLKIGGKPVEIEVELLGADNKTKEFLTKIIHIDKQYQSKLPIGSTFRIPARIFRLPGGGWHKIKSSAFNEETAPEIIKDLDKVRNDLIKKVDVLIAKKKKLYSNVDIESPMSADEKQLDKDIQSIFSQIQQIILKKRNLKESLNEGIQWEADVFTRCMQGQLPLSLNIVQKLVDPIVAKSLHVTDIANLPKVAALEGTKKSISTFNKTTKWGKIAQGKGLWTEGGVIVSLSGVILAQSIMDLWTRPDKQGRRWVEPGTVISGLGRSVGQVFEFAPHLEPFKKRWLNLQRYETTEEKIEFTPQEKNKFIRDYFEAAEKYMLSKKKEFKDQYLNSNKLHYDVDWNEVVLTNIKIEKILVIPNIPKTKTNGGSWEWDTKDAKDTQKEINKIKQKYRNVEVAKNEADIENFINNNGGEVIRENINKTKKVISEGGAYGHMSHPFDDMKLTFGDLKKIIKGALVGELELTREKTDGQALAISWKNGRLIAARNKGHLANAGANAMGIEDVASKFAGRGGLTDAYNFAMRDLTAAISSLSDGQRKKIFDEGKCFMNLEVIWPTSVNVIPYGQALLIFHNTTCYNEAGVAIGANQSAATMLAGMIKQVNADVQSQYTIKGPPVTQLPKNEELSSKQNKYITQLQRLQHQFQLSDRATVSEYHQAWWENFIDKDKPKLQKLEREALVRRWAFGDKSFRLNTIADKDAQKWAMAHDKVNVEKQQKENVKPFEELFLSVGADVLSFMSSVLTVNPDIAIRNMAGRLEATADKVRGSGDVTKLQKLEKELQRLANIGGKDKIVPNEGIVFVYKGNTYKLTGTFAPLNQILGIFYE